MAQLPPGAEGAVAGVQLWAWVCFLTNVLLLWLLWSVQERRSYIFIVSCVTLLATTSSIVEQIYTIINYRDMVVARLELVKQDPNDPFVQVTDGSSGLSLILWEIRWGCYIAEAGIAFFWAFSLTQSVYGWRDDIRLHRILDIINESGKVLPLIGAALTMAVFQIPTVQSSFFWSTFAMNFFYMASCAGGVLMFVLILIEFFQTRRLLRRMNSQQRRDYLHQPPTSSHNRSSSTPASFVTVGRVHTGTEQPFGTLQQRQGGINDNYLIARTFVPALALFLFEIDNILANNSHPEALRKLSHQTNADLSAAAAASHFSNFIPGCLASLVLFLAFATTRQLLDYMYCAFVPTRFQSAARRRAIQPPLTPEQGHRRYVAMDKDGGMLSRQKRLSMEKRLRIEVTYEFEVRNEQVDGEQGARKTGAEEGKEKKGVGGIYPFNKGSAIYPYNVENHHWDDTEHILPKKPNMPVLMGHGLLDDD